MSELRPEEQQGNASQADCGLPCDDGMAASTERDSVLDNAARRAAVTVLVVDDEPSIGELLGQLLAREGYSVVVRTDPREAWALIEQEEPTVLLSDLRMPGMNGIELLEKVRAKFPDVAVLMISAVDETSAAIAAFRRGAYGYITKPFNPDEVIIQVAGAVHRRELEIAYRRHNKELERKVYERTLRLNETLAELRAAHEALTHSYEDTILRIATAAEYRDEESGRHIRRMSQYCRSLARALQEYGAPGCQVSDEFVRFIELASPMHDVGKIGVPDHILRKPGRLTPEEYEQMKAHTLIGARIFADARAPLLQMAGRVAVSHHERFDGSGYPYGLAGHDIPLEGRIVAVADVFDALTTDRVYKPAYPPDVAFRMMLAQRGIHFDPDILDVFLRIQGEVLDIRLRLSEGRSSAVASGDRRAHP